MYLRSQTRFTRANWVEMGPWRPITACNGPPNGLTDLPMCPAGRHGPIGRLGRQKVFGGKFVKEGGVKRIPAHRVCVAGRILGPTCTKWHIRWLCAPLLTLIDSEPARSGSVCSMSLKAACFSRAARPTPHGLFLTRYTFCLQAVKGGSFAHTISPKLPVLFHSMCGLRHM